MRVNNVDFVITSEVTIPSEDADLLQRAFQDRMGLLEAAPGVQRIEVWRNVARPGVFQLASWWDSAEQFRSCMRSEDHRRSHARIPEPPHKPRGTGVGLPRVKRPRFSAAPTWVAALG